MTTFGDKGRCGEEVGLHSRRERAILCQPQGKCANITQSEDYTRAATQTDDTVFRKMLLMLALQWRLAAQEDQSTGNEVAARSSARDAA